MSRIRREILWAASVLLQIVAIGALTPVGDWLLRYDWFARQFRIPNESMLVPVTLAFWLLAPVLATIVVVWAWQIARASSGRTPRAGALVHGAGAFLGALAIFWRLHVNATGELVPSAWILVPVVPLTMVAFVLVSWPRLALRRLVAAANATSVPPRS